MILEYSQLLSSAHRFLDGVKTKSPIDDHEFPARSRHFYLLEGESIKLEEVFDLELMHVIRWWAIDRAKCYGHTHLNHPSTVWTRATNSNYQYLYSLLIALHAEFMHRYDKVHKSTALLDFLKIAPINIPIGSYYDPTPAMAEEFKISSDSLTCYRNYYCQGKKHLATWKNREIPTWYA